MLAPPGLFTGIGPKGGGGGLWRRVGRVGFGGVGVNSGDKLRGSAAERGGEGHRACACDGGSVVRASGVI